MKQGFINFLAFIALTLGPLSFWKSEFGQGLLESGYGWAAYVSAPLLASVFAAIAAKGFKGKTFWVLFAIFSVGLLLMGLAVNLDV